MPWPPAGLQAMERQLGHMDHLIRHMPFVMAAAMDARLADLRGHLLAALATQQHQHQQLQLQQQGTSVHSTLTSMDRHLLPRYPTSVAQQPYQPHQHRPSQASTTDASAGGGPKSSAAVAAAAGGPAGPGVGGGGPPGAAGVLPGTSSDPGWALGSGLGGSSSESPGDSMVQLPPAQGGSAAQAGGAAQQLSAGAAAAPAGGNPSRLAMRTSPAVFAAAEQQQASGAGLPAR